MHDLKTAANDARTAEALAYLLRRGAGGDVVILGRNARQQVSHRTTDDVGLVAVLLEGFDGAAAAAAECVTANAVLLETDHGGLAAPADGTLPEEAGNEFSDHFLVRWKVGSEM